MIIELHEFTRVEGNGRAEIVIEDGEVKDVRLKIVEGPRFFELLTLGRHYYDVPDLEARICAICYLAHSVASVMGIERAFGVEVPEEIKLLRELGLIGELLESHALHLYLLVAPDVLGYPDAIRMAAKHGELVKEGLALKAFGNRIRELIGGREIHGINVKPGGFGRYPTVEELEEIERESEALLKLAKRAVRLFAGLGPYGERAKHFVATDGYLWGERLISEEGGPFHYTERIEERSLVYSFAKQSKYNGESFLVGALPRLLLKAKTLTPEAKRLFEEQREKLETGYVSYNNLAQAIELVYSLERAGEIAKTLLDRGINGENVPVEPGEGEGIGYVEAPRGVLIHHYRTDSEGKIVYSNIITPTALNHAMMEASLLKEAKALYGEVEEGEMVKKLEETVRAFDPCISCSVHLVKL
ncbi:NAD(P)-dependent hydrogenase/sulfhydrogenase 2 subunit alpha [Thermococcus waiotapuensis]|uniref:NAD(P)-dependent hydrogenase/sulfhydrogenase 2 subunit alpha n=1 Tax=Thermococcus waiotapuensis TaxID=90909 RepID=A0AAE4T279_9EURY|nr:NAD(P)-dependent hydrogenase/sulfhydrogenase 2 subunit alpha [Thermococcus waiotapuensis]MDV3103837.1 NAD(P)-dependent hydrogenase/sulfhydrogenase 2 subunit alpha [Thermococcus waiotapuensis]